MPSLAVFEKASCELVSWPFSINSCAWQQWLPLVLGLTLAFILRSKGIARLMSYLAGIAAFYFCTVVLALLTPPQTSEEMARWFFMGCLFFFPVAALGSLFGLICGDALRILQKRARSKQTT